MGSLQSLFIIFAARAKLGSHSDIATHFDITKRMNIRKYLNSARRNFESVELRKRDRGSKALKEQSREVLCDSLFLLTRPGSVTQAPPLQAKREAFKRLPKQPKLYLKQRQLAAQTKVRVGLLTSLLL